MADSSKTEEATPRRRLKAREQGQVTRSRELSGALTMFAVAGAISVTALDSAHHWTEFFRNVLDSASSDAIEPSGPLLYWTSIEALRSIVPILTAALGASLLVGYAQGGFVFAAEALSFKPERISPASKLKSIFSTAGLSSSLKSLLPFSAILWVGYDSVNSHWNQILMSSYSDTRSFANLVGGMLMQVCWKSGLILVGWSGVDYFLIWMKSKGDMKMSREDIKEEMKQSDGNPATKSRIRRMQRQSRRKQMIKAAHTATVVITNPTHYAVALRYEVNMPAPIIVAKGLDLLAQKIKEIAWDHNIPVMENRPLAQALYKGAEVGDAIPSALYHAVAEILVMVYKAQAEVKNREAQRRAAANQQGEVRL
jgi:flagellar biosynthetic protein FlhB